MHPVFDTPPRLLRAVGLCLSSSLMLGCDLTPVGALDGSADPAPKTDAATLTPTDAGGFPDAGRPEGCEGPGPVVLSRQATSGLELSSVGELDWWWASWREDDYAVVQYTRIPNPAETIEHRSAARIGPCVAQSRLVHPASGPELVFADCRGRPGTGTLLNVHRYDLTGGVTTEFWMYGNGRPFALDAAVRPDGRLATLLLEPPGVPVGPGGGEGGTEVPGLLRLREEGRAELSRPLEESFPGLTGLDVSSFRAIATDAGFVVVVRGRRQGQAHQEERLLFVRSLSEDLTPIGSLHVLGETERGVAHVLDRFDALYEPESRLVFIGFLGVVGRLEASLYLSWVPERGGVPPPPALIQHHATLDLLADLGLAHWNRELRLVWTDSRESMETPIYAGAALAYRAFDPTASLTELDSRSPDLMLDEPSPRRRQAPRLHADGVPGGVLVSVLESSSNRLLVFRPRLVGPCARPMDDHPRQLPP